MPIRKTKCPFCNISVENQKKLCVNDRGNSIKCIKVHSKKVKDGSVQYRCTNYKGHGWIKGSKHSKNWYYVTFYDKPTLNGKRYLYQKAVLHDFNTFRDGCLKNSHEFLDKTIIDGIRLLDESHLIYQFIKANVPELLSVKDYTFTAPSSIGKRNLQILLYHLKGFSQELIAELLDINKRETVSQIINEFSSFILWTDEYKSKVVTFKTRKSVKKLNMKKFKINASVVYRKKDEKIIESKYYNKAKGTDFQYIS
jgi:hypothetical protein